MQGSQQQLEQCLLDLTNKILTDVSIDSNRDNRLIVVNRIKEITNQVFQKFATEEFRKLQHELRQSQSYCDRLQEELADREQQIINECELKIRGTEAFSLREIKELQELLDKQEEQLKKQYLQNDKQTKQIKELHQRDAALQSELLKQKELTHQADVESKMKGSEVFENKQKTEQFQQLYQQVERQFRDNKAELDKIVKELQEQKRKSQQNVEQIIALESELQSAKDEIERSKVRKQQDNNKYKEALEQLKQKSNNKIKELKDRLKETLQNQQQQQEQLDEFRELVKEQELQFNSLQNTQKQAAQQLEIQYRKQMEAQERNQSEEQLKEIATISRNFEQIIQDKEQQISEKIKEVKSLRDKLSHAQQDTDRAMKNNLLLEQQQIKLNNENKQIMGDIEELQQKYQDLEFNASKKDQKIKTLNLQIQQLELNSQQLHDAKSQIEEIVTKDKLTCDDLNKKLNIMVSEKHQLSLQLDDSKFKLKAIASRVQRIAQRHKEQLNQVIQEIRGFVINKIKAQENECRVIIQNIIKKFTNVNESKVMQLNIDYKEQLEQMQEDCESKLEQLKKQLKSKESSSVEEWQGKLKQKDQQIDGLLQQISNDKTVDGLRDQLHIQLKDNERLQQQLTVMEKQAKDNQINYEHEISELNALIKEHQEELQAQQQFAEYTLSKEKLYFDQKYNDYKTSSELKKQQLQDEVLQLNCENEELQQITVKKDQKIKQLQQDVYELEQNQLQFQNAKGQIEELLLKEQRVQEESHRKLAMMGHDKHQLILKLDEAQFKLKALASRTERMMRRQKEQLQTALNDLRNLFSNKIKVLESECKVLLQSALKKFINMHEGRVQQLENGHQMKVDQMTDDMDSRVELLKKQYKQSEQLMQEEAQIKLKQKQTQIDHLLIQMQNDNTVDDLKSQLHKYLKENEHMAQSLTLQDKLFKEKCNAYEGEIRNLSRSLQEHQDELAAQQQFTDYTLNKERQYFEQKYNDLKMQSERKNETLQYDYQQQIKQLESIVIQPQAPRVNSPNHQHKGSLQNYHKSPYQSNLSSTKSQAQLKPQLYSSPGLSSSMKTPNKSPQHYYDNTDKTIEELRNEIQLQKQKLSRMKLNFTDSQKKPQKGQSQQRF